MLGGQAGRPGKEVALSLSHGREQPCRVPRVVWAKGIASAKALGCEVGVRSSVSGGVSGARSFLAR